VNLLQVLAVLRKSLQGRIGNVLNVVQGDGVELWAARSDRLDSFVGDLSTSVKIQDLNVLASVRDHLQSSVCDGAATQVEDIESLAFARHLLQSDVINASARVCNDSLDVGAFESDLSETNRCHCTSRDMENSKVLAVSCNMSVERESIRFRY